MLAFDLIAEQRIREAEARGEFDHLPGAGRPLDLTEDPLVPEDQRMALRVLKNAGFVPPEIETRRQIRALELLVAESADAAERTRALRRLEALSLQLAESRRRGLALDARYHARILARFG